MPTPTTVSTCTPETDLGKHVFEISGYSEYKVMYSGEFIMSGSFSVGGFDWAIRFYPSGMNYDTRGNIYVCLELLSKNAKVRAFSELSLVDQTTGSPSMVDKTGLMVFESCGIDGMLARPYACLYVRRSLFENSACLRDDHLTVLCSVTVKKPRVSTTRFLNQVEAPPSNITEQLGKLLDSEEGADVTFSVGGETFKAHKVVLAMRSPVFKAELYGPMTEAREQHVTIEDVQPAVFRALLHFIYTDSLPDRDHLGGSEMIWHLLVAADIYAVDRLKSVCESILCKNLDVETVSTTLALAHQHSCDKLKEFCLQFTSSPNVMDAVVATKGYKNLKATCPIELIDIFEKTALLN
ncbi:hypothetical protein EJB05_09011, partial [Eragrostis curvula]